MFQDDLPVSVNVSRLRSEGAIDAHTSAIIIAIAETEARGPHRASPISEQCLRFHLALAGCGPGVLLPSQAAEVR
jgi:hypothetical protein